MFRARVVRIRLEAEDLVTGEQNIERQWVFLKDVSAPRPYRDAASNPQQNTDNEHIRLLSIYHYVVSGAVAFFACIPIIHLVIGLIFIFSVYLTYVLIGLGIFQFLYKSLIPIYVPPAT